jgi:hypothetical protein
MRYRKAAMIDLRSRGRGMAHFAWMAVLILAICAALFVRDAKTGTEDFGYFYRAADAMRHGEDIYRAAGGHYIYPPLLAFVLQPLTFLPENTAIFVWLAVSAIAVFCAAAIAAQETTTRWLSGDGKPRSHIVWAVAAVATILATDKLHKMFGLGQSDAFVLLGFALCLRWMERRPVLAGVVVGVVANIKYLSVIFVPYFVVKRNYRAALSAVISFAFLLLLPSLQVGVARGVAYATAAFGGLGRMVGLGSSHRLKILDVTWDRSVSITSAVFRWTRSAHWPDGLTMLLLMFLFAAVVATLILIAHRSSVPLFTPDRAAPPEQRHRVVSLEWAALVLFAVAFSPQTTARHMVLALLVYTVVIPVFLAQKKSIARVVLAVCAAVMAASLSLPPSGPALNIWRNISGASWCALLLTTVLVWTGSRAAIAPNDQTDRTN